MRLQTRFAAAILVLLLLLLPALAGGFLFLFDHSMDEARQLNQSAMKTALLEQADKQAAGMANLVADALANPLYYFEIEVIGQFLRSTREQRNVAFAILYDNTGTIIHDGTESIALYGQKIEDVLTEKARRTGTVATGLQDNVMVAAAPIRIGADYLGGVRVGLSLGGIFKDIDETEIALESVSRRGSRNVFSATAVAALASLVIGGLLAALVARGLSQPIARLVDYTRRVGRGEYETGAPLRRDDEIGELAHSLHDMVEQRREAEERLRRASDAGGVGLWEWSIEDDRFYVSPNLYAMLGLEQDQVGSLRKNWESLIHPEDMPLLMKRRDAHLAGKTPEYQADFRMFHRDGSVRWFSARGLLQRGAGGKPYRALGTVIDITDRVRAERQLGQYRKLESLGSLAGGMAHEINNMLHPIIVLTESALTRLSPRSRERAKLERVLEAGERIKGLVEQILAFGRARQDGEIQSIEVQKAAADTFDFLRTMAFANVQFHHRMDIGEMHAPIDPTDFNTVLVNLFSNAVAAMNGAPGHVDVVLDRLDIETTLDTFSHRLKAGSYLRITVIDDGCGMDTDTLEHLLDPFFTTKEVGQGTGLGLSIVHGIVSKAGGALDFRSAPGKGTTAIAYLPLTPGLTTQHASDTSREPTEDRSAQAR